MRLLKIIIGALCVWGAIDGWQMREIVRAPGSLAPDPPLQRAIQSGAAFTHANHTLTPRARFDATARVLSGERYRMDTGASLMPRDIAFGWGSMSDSTALARVKISQSGRFAFWRTDERPSDSDIATINSSIANMHLIPANDSVRNAILRARVGQIVSFSGMLVDVRAPSGWSINTSLSRSDTGAGACEVVYVETFDPQ